MKLYVGTRDCFRSMVRSEGYSAFYAGFLLNLLRVGPQTAVHLLIYNEAVGFFSDIIEDHVQESL